MAKDNGESLELNPRFERTALIDNIKDVFAINEPETAIYVADNLLMTTILKGDVEPFKSAGRIYYRGLNLCLTSTGKFAEIAYIQSGKVQNSSHFDLHPTEESLAGLSNEQAEADSVLRHVLGRVVFSRDEAESQLQTLLTLSGVDGVIAPDQQSNTND